MTTPTRVPLDPARRVAPPEKWEDSSPGRVAAAALKAAQPGSAEYRVVTAVAAGFQREVNALFADGWLPVPGTAAAAGTSDPLAVFSLVLTRGPAAGELPPCRTYAELSARSGRPNPADIEAERRRLLEADAVTYNEARAWNDLPPVAGGDVPVSRYLAALEAARTPGPAAGSGPSPPPL